MCVIQLLINWHNPRSAYVMITARASMLMVRSRAARSPVPSVTTDIKWRMIHGPTRLRPITPARLTPAMMTYLR